MKNKTENKMRYYVECKGIGLKEDEQRIEVKLKVGDYCVVDLENNDEAIIRITKRTYYPIVKTWMFLGELVEIQHF